MMRLLKQDVQFQFRHGFYYVYAFFTVVYIAILLFIPSDYRSFWTVLIIFTDPGTLGLFFVGTIIMLERNQQLLTYMFITPLKLSTYLLSKIISLTLIAWLTSLLIVTVTLGTTTSFLLLSLTIVLCSFFFTACGMAISVDAPSLNHFMFRSIILLLVLCTPFLHYLNWISFSIFEIMPSYSVLVLLQLSIEGSGLIHNESLVHFSLLIIWTLVAFSIAFYRFRKYISAQTGESKEVSV
ncbi:hypothetical protein ACERJO_19330 [Halalkalibacter sp. AB-rgal2]|uniref:fluoroquinolone export ABC transporter permease subunit n=1 Tax=Halalkalibacter sp. AB-rgal2 TaxID=3242695 RepID=UPI00359E23C9